MISDICNFLILKHQKLVYLFLLSYILLGIVVILSFFLPSVNQTSKLFGKLALLTYVSTLIPGMGKRFGINYLPITVLFVYRRQLGILMFLLALVHMITSGVFFTKEPFIVAGQVAIFILLLLFITSNNFSVKILSKYWYTLQQFTYVAIVFVFCHLILVRFSLFSLLILIVMIVELISFLKILHSNK